MRKKLAVCFLLSVFVNKSWAEEIPASNEELNEVQSGIKAASQNMQRIQLQKNTLNAQLGEVEKLYGRTAALLKTLQGQVEQKRENLNRIRQEK
jgi:septal ring factor EnvC (AmiA/AmiB activator)